MQEQQAVIAGIMQAFEFRTLPKQTPLFTSSSSEVDEQKIEQLARNTSWQELPHDVIRANPLALAYATPDAFAWLLPAYLVVSIALYAETDALTSSIISVLTRPDEAAARQFEELANAMDDLDLALPGGEGATDCFAVDEEDLRRFADRASVLSSREKVAVRDYLRYVESAHGVDFPVFGPRAALERYWAEV